MSRYGNLIYGGVDSGDFGIYVVDVNDSDMPLRDYSVFSIPGKTRDLHYDNVRYNNIDRIYKCIVFSLGGRKASEIVTDYISRIMPIKGYQRIEDSIHQEYYKMGEYRGGTVPNLSSSKDGAEFELAFDCDPRKYLRTGEEEVSLSAGTTALFNPGSEESRPLLRISGSGTIQFGGVTMIIAAHTGVMVIDCELGDAYSETGHTNYNEYVTLNGEGEFPVLAPGSNNVVVSGLSLCMMTPRWCKL